MRWKKVKEDPLILSLSVAGKEFRLSPGNPHMLAYIREDEYFCETVVEKFYDKKELIKKLKSLGLPIPREVDHGAEGSGGEMEE